MPREKVVFVYLGSKFPRYANASLELAAEYSGLDITLLLNATLRHKVKSRSVELISIEEFYSPLDFVEIDAKIDLPLSFRNGFWSKTLERFFVIKQYMEISNSQGIFHAELDQILFRCDKLIEALKASQFKGLALPFHTLDKGIASVLYCNDIKNLESLLDFAKVTPRFKNEMELIGKWAKSNPQMVSLLPTLASEVKGIDSFERSGFHVLDHATIGGIVDGAQVGQWIGGEDPRNIEIRYVPMTKYVDAPSADILSFSELSRVDLKLDSSNSLLVSYDKSSEYYLYNIHVHSKIHPWIVKSGRNLVKLLNQANKPEPVALSISRKIQILEFIGNGYKAVSSHPGEFMTRSLSRIFNKIKSQSN